MPHKITKIFDQAPVFRLVLIVALCTIACVGFFLPGSASAARMPHTHAAPSYQTGTVQAEQIGHRIRFERIAIEQELSQSSVYCILQDAQGFMWLGTRDGLNKYDGYSFITYRHDPAAPDSLSSNTVRALYEDKGGILWIGTENGLNKFDRLSGRFVRYQNDLNNPSSLSYGPVTSLLQDQAGTLWVGTDGGGLNRFDPETEGFIHYRHVLDGSNSLSDNSVRAIYEDHLGSLWIGTGGGGLDQFDRKTGFFTNYRYDSNDPSSLSNNEVLAIHEDLAGVLWVGTDGGGLNRLDRQTGQFVRYQHYSNDPNSLGNNTVLAIYADSLGTLWIGTGGGGLDKLDRETGRFVIYRNDPLDPSSLSTNVVYSIYEDRSGALWVGTGGGGLNKSDAGKRGFVHYRNDPKNTSSLGSNDVLQIWEDHRGALWVGTSGGLDKLTSKAEQFIHYRALPRVANSLLTNRITALYEDRSGAIWIGASGGGLSKLDPDTGHFIHYKPDPKDGFSLSSSIITAIYEDSSGVLWVGTGGGLNRLGPGTENFIHYKRNPNDPNSLSHNTVRTIYQDREGMLWIGTENGLNEFDPDTEKFVRYLNDPQDPATLSNNIVTAIHQDQAGILWIATFGGGLDRFDRKTGRFASYREKDGLPSDTLYGLLQDDLGYFWISTNKGLSKFDPRTGLFKTYDVRDGLQSNEFNAGAFHKGRSGKFYFGGVNGLTAFEPADIADNHYVPPIVLTSLTQSGEQVQVGGAVESVSQVTFVWPNNFFGFEFAALNYIQPEKNQYAYMLEDFEKEWNYVGTRRFGKYTNLPGGTYTLRVKGSNNDGVWNEKGLALQVTIVPPFWDTWWFRGIATLIVVGSVLGGYQIRVRSIAARNRELKMLVDERTHTLEQRTREIERRRQELEALYRADAELYRHLHLDEVLQTLVDIAVDILKADKSGLLVWDEQQQELVMHVARGFSPEAMANLSFAWGEGITGQVAANGEPAIVEDALADPRRKGERAESLRIIESEGICSFMHLPIKIADEIFGVFNVSFTEPHAFGEDEQRLFLALAQRAALAIENAQLYEQTQESAVAEERNRLARELHDAVTQTLFSSSLIAETLPTLWENDQEEGRQLLKELRQLSRGALAEMRTLLLELRPAALAEANLSDLLRQLGEAVTGRKGVPVKVSIQGECEFPADVHVALYRIAQEALNNVVKHANATQIVVSLRCMRADDESEYIELRVQDNGCGFDQDSIPPDRLGLDIIRERAQAINAALDIQSQPGCGTRIVVVWQKDIRVEQE